MVAISGEYGTLRTEKAPQGGHGFIYKPSGQLHWLNKLKREKEERDDGLEMYAADYRIGTG